MAYTTIDNPELYFQAKLHTGNATNRSITLDGSEDMQPDFVWIKQRSGSNNHEWFDAVRGATKRIYSDVTNAEDTGATTLTSFDSDGFSLGTGNPNNDGGTYVSWCWKAGAGSGSSNTDGGINTTSTSVSQTAGFSISTWTGTGSTATVGHGLGAVPKFITTKARSDTYDWYTYHASIGNTKNVYLNLNNAESSASANFHNNTDPTSSVWTAGGNIYNDTYTFVTYAFAEKQGFSKFGKYYGTGSTHTYIHLGFRPAFFMVKRINSTENWYMKDNKRDTFNDMDASVLYANGDAAEDTGGAWLTGNATANGFVITKNDTSSNGSGDTYIYLAFAEAPFVNSNGVPGNAR